MEDREYLLHIERAIREIQVTVGLLARGLRARLEDPAGGRAQPPDHRRCRQQDLEGARDSLPEIEWEEIYAARNIVVHHYFGVNNEIVWDILLEDIPRLRAAVEALLAPRE